MVAENRSSRVRTPESPALALWLNVVAILTVMGVIVQLVGIVAWSWLRGYHFEGDYELPRFQNPHSHRRDLLAPGEVIGPALVLWAAALFGWLAAVIVAVPVLVFLGWSLHDRLRLNGSSGLMVAGRLLHRLRNSDLLWAVIYLLIVPVTGLANRVASLYDRIRF